MRYPSILLLLLTCKVGYAQVRTNCGIYYDYDTKGQRTRQYYHCSPTDYSSPSLPRDVAGPPMALAAVQDRKVQPEQDITALSYVLYPNPAQRWIRVRGPMVTGGIAYFITDMRGLLFAKGLWQHAVELEQDISSWPAGAYILSLHLPTGRLALKFMVVN